MNTESRSGQAAARRPVRCVIYTRKSTEDGLAQEFNSLDAQREAAEAFIRSQSGEGWILQPERFDDGGYTGGNTERPALQRLLHAIRNREVDCVVVYKVDRLSRSLLDFAKLMEVFDAHGVSFVSVTQQFNTTHSMGRLTLNILLSFAQFEREIIAERTRDKIAATRRKGKWTGGPPILGYTVTPQRTLAILPDEADQVRAIFQCYLDHGSLLTTVDALRERGWTTKRWLTRNGRTLGGRPFDRTNLYHLLTNVLYAGQVRYKDEIHPGQQEAIVPPDLWQRVQDQLTRHGRTGGADARNRFGALLKGLLRCVPCGCAMTPTHATRQGRIRYRYYVCSTAQKRGRDGCPSKSIPAGPIEDLVRAQLLQRAGGAVLTAESSPWQQQQTLRRWVREIGYDGRTGTVAIQFAPSTTPDASSVQGQP